MTEADYIARWAAAFALTVAVELPCAVWLLSASNASTARRAGVVVAAQFVTHPIVWFVIPFFHLARWPFLAVAEGWAWGAETAVYGLAFPGLSPRQAAVASLVANAASVAVGYVARATLGIV